MIDADNETWLIEVNSNPCLEESSQLLKGLLPQMIEGMMVLCVDPTFPPRGNREFMEKYREITAVQPFFDPICCPHVAGSGNENIKRTGPVRKDRSPSASP